MTISDGLEGPQSTASSCGRRARRPPRVPVPLQLPSRAALLDQVERIGGARVAGEPHPAEQEQRLEHVVVPIRRPVHRHARLEDLARRCDRGRGVREQELAGTLGRRPAAASPVAAPYSCSPQAAGSDSLTTSASRSPPVAVPAAVRPLPPDERPRARTRSSSARPSRQQAATALPSWEAQRRTRPSIVPMLSCGAPVAGQPAEHGLDGLQRPRGSPVGTPSSARATRRQSAGPHSPGCRRGGRGPPAGRRAARAPPGPRGSPRRSRPACWWSRSRPGQRPDRRLLRLEQPVDGGDRDAHVRLLHRSSALTASRRSLPTKSMSGNTLVALHGRRMPCRSVADASQDWGSSRVLRIASDFIPHRRLRRAYCRSRASRG